MPLLKLRKVQILGFKSFCDRTEVQLAGHGIASIVGPYGCGKSNISDAITWFLGEQSAKSLRGIKMEDVIFAGTRDRKATGMAEVSLTLVDPEVYDDAAHGPELVSSTATSRKSPAIGTKPPSAPKPLKKPKKPPRRCPTRHHIRSSRQRSAGSSTNTPLLKRIAKPPPKPSTKTRRSAEGHATHDAPTEASLAPASDNVVLKIRRRKFSRAPIRAGEITITRRLFRTGDSEYLLNGKICRLRDIQDIFMGTGLGGETYAIIGQERIGQLLSSKPLDRRSIIEEAAGITRFKTKKRLAELRLESAKQNLARVNDIFEEVTKQMVTLKRQAAKAERYGALRDELRGKLRIVLASRLAQMDTEQTSISAEIARLATQIDAQAMALEAMDAEHSSGARQGLRTRSADPRSRRPCQPVRRRTPMRIAARTASNADRVADLTRQRLRPPAKKNSARPARNSKRSPANASRTPQLPRKRNLRSRGLPRQRAAAATSRSGSRPRALRKPSSRPKTRRRSAMHIMQRAARSRQ